MPAERRVGMDHDHYAWSPMPTRNRLEWPDRARVALCVIVSLEHTEWLPPEDSRQAAPQAAGMIGRPYPDYSRLTHREYGHRVGIFRILDVLEKHGIPATIAMDAMTAEHYPYLVNYGQQRDCEIMAHGVAATRMITSEMTEQGERDYIDSALNSLSTAIGKRPSGWLGAEYGESFRTPQLLAAAGIRYVCDWVNDEQPYRMTSPASGELYALPMMLELDDVHALWERRVNVPRYGQLLQDAFNRLYTDGAQNGRLLVVHLHPWLMGQPFRIRYLDEALGVMMQRRGVWAAQAGAIIDWYRQQ